ncbi:C10 family peptidase [Falsiporphyromonas endometrii]|uniref:C10 family peptidase n=1 Tax=Falsiporphyromonas endometrii TaxID=1387297 RepID=A0ABV9K9K7_9PORP
MKITRAKQTVFAFLKLRERTNWLRKPILSLLILFMGVGMSFALPVTPSQAKKAAQEFFKSKSSLRGESNLSLQLLSAPNFMGEETVGLRSEDNSRDNSALYYIYNRGEHDGFVMIAGDDKLPLVLGYTLNGKFSTQHMPDNLKAFLETYQQNIKMLLKANKTSSNRLRSIETVNPLLGNIQWDQSFPWNAHTPKDSEGKNMPVGCVATATSQIMRYYKWPLQGEGKHEYIDSKSNVKRKADFTKTYDWDHMPARYDDPRTATKEEQDALGILCLHVGIAEDMGYGSNASGSFIQNVVRALRDNFKYDKRTKVINRNLKTQSQWETIIRGELNSKRPVLYAGYGQGGGHAFVCDGYDNEGLYHFNWGWGGMSDGYFDLNVLSPGALGIGGGSGGGFNEGQCIVVNFQPDKTQSTQAPNTFIEGDKMEIDLSSAIDKNASVCKMEVKLTEILALSTSVRLVLENTNDSKDKYILPQEEEVELDGRPVYPTPIKFTLQRRENELVLDSLNTEYKVYAEAKAEDGEYYRVRGLYGTPLEQIITTDEHGCIKSAKKDIDRGKISINKNGAIADLFGYEKSKITCLASNTMKREQIENTVLRIVKHSNQKLLFEFDKNVPYEMGQDNRITFFIDRLPIEPGTKVDISLKTQFKYRETTILEDVEVKKASTVREGYLIKFDETKWDQRINPESVHIKGFSIEDVATEHQPKDLAVLAYLSYDYMFSKINCIINRQDLHLKDWDGSKHEFEITLGDNPEEVSRFKEFSKVLATDRVDLHLIVFDKNTGMPVTVLEMDEIKVGFKQPKIVLYKIDIQKSEHGNISLANVDNPDAVKENTIVEVSINPDKGYEIDQLLINDVNIAPDTFFKLTKNTTIKATFKVKRPVITLTQYGEGEVVIEGADLSKSHEVDLGTQITIKATPKEGNMIKVILINGVEAENNKTYTINEDTNIIVSFILDTPVDNISSNDIVIYPNPTADLINVTNTTSNATVRLYSISGQLIKATRTDSEGSLVMNLSDLPQGIYIISIDNKIMRIEKR